MKTSTVSSFLTKMMLLLLFSGVTLTLRSQTVPEYIYYKFDVTGNQQNYASAPVGNNPAVLTGLTTGPTGQFGNALIGNGLTSSSNNLNTGWGVNLPNTGWTISFWMNNMPATVSTTFYFFGDATASSFRCFTGGVAGNGNLWLRATGLTDVPINGVATTSYVIHLVYTGTAVKVFKNGVLANTVAQSSVSFTGTGPFTVGGYTSSNSIPAGTLLDEFRVYNRALSDAEVALTWNQSLPIATGPTVVTTAATAVGSTDATLNGTINANNASTTASFEYGLTTAYGTPVSATPGTVTGNTVTPVSAVLSGLLPNTTYHYRVVGVNSNGTSNGTDMTFTTNPSPPTAITSAATAIGLASATLNGSVNAMNASSVVTFEYGPTTAYGSSIPGIPSPVTGNALTPVSGSLPGLTANTLYHFRVKAVNAGGTTNGNDTTFRTAGAPTAVTNLPTNVTATGAQMNGTVTANLLSTTVTFEYGPTTSYGTSIGATPGTVTGNTPTAVLATLTGLPTGVTYHYRVVTVNAGGTTYGLDQTFLTGCPQPAPAGIISGPVSVCRNGSGYVYSVAPITNAISYSWTLPTGGSPTSGSGTNSITVSYNGTASSGNVSVAGVGSCGSGTASSLAVTVNPAPVPAITGSAIACQGATMTYTTQSGMTGYTWTVSSGGNIQGPSNTNTINVIWSTTGAKTVTANFSNANGCSAGTPTSFAVTVNVSPAPTISGITSMCSNSGYFDYVTQPGFTNYQWTTSSGGTITWGGTTNQAQVTWSGSGPQWVAVNYTNSSGCAAGIPVQLPVNVTAAPGPASAISGVSTVCAGTNGVIYTTPVIQGALFYVWSLPSGATIANGAGNDTITVNYDANAVSGDIRVYANNLCGNGALSPVFAVTVNPLPAPAGTITGPATVCAGTTGVVYSVGTIANASSYNWIIPAGVTITSDSSTSSITVSFANNAVSGNITVTGNNACGMGTVSPDFAVTVTQQPAAPVVTESGDTLSSSVALGNQWYYSPTMGGAGTLIAGATAQTYVAMQNGWYWSVLTVGTCSSDSSNQIHIVGIGISDMPEASSLNVYPVPNDGMFSLTFTGKAKKRYSVTVYNTLGSAIYEKNNIRANGTTTQLIDLRPVASGVYNVMFSDGISRVIKRIIISE